MNPVLNNVTEKNWNTNITTDGTYYYKAACWNETDGLSANTSIRSFIMDTTIPEITINPNNAFNTSNISFINQYLNAFPVNITFTDDRDLFGYSINITQGLVIAFNVSNETSTGHKGINFTKELNTSQWKRGVYDIELIVSDSHTNNIIEDYGVSQFLNKVTFRTPELNEISISSIGAYSTYQEKFSNKYKFGFDYVLLQTSRTFTLESDKKITYLENSDYNAHFVVWNGKNGNWIDFEGIGDNYMVKEINEKKYEITFTNLEKERSVILNSIGGLNVVTKNYRWFKGNYTLDFTTPATSESTQTFKLNVSKSVGFVDNVDASFRYNGTYSAVTKNDFLTSSLFTATVTAPEEEDTFSFIWDVNVTQNNSNQYNFSIVDSQNVFLAQINVSIKDETNQSLITEEVTVFFTLEQTLQRTTSVGSVSIGNLTLGEYFIEGESASYPRRGTFFTIDNQTSQLDLFLVIDATGNEAIDYFVKDTSQRNIEDVRMTFQKSINNSFITVAQAETDFAGQAQVFQDQQTEYRIILSHDSFPTKTLSLRPLLTEYTIFLDAVLDSLYDNVWEGIQYTLIPNQRIFNISNTSVNISLDIFADDSSLEWFAVLLDQHNYTCIPASCLTNISNSPAGGRATVAIKGNFTGTFDVHYFFKRTGFDTQYIHGSLYGFQIVAKLFGENMANWLDKFTDGLGGRTEGKIALAFLAAISTAVLCAVAAGFGVAGIALVMVALFGNFFFMIAGFINPFIAIAIAIVGISTYFVFGGDN